MTLYSQLLAKAADWRYLAERSEADAAKFTEQHADLNAIIFKKAAALLRKYADELEALARQVCAEAQAKCVGTILASTVALDVIGGPDA